GKFKMAEGLSYEGASTRFEGYEQLSLDDVAVTALYVDGTKVDSMAAGQQGVVVLDATPFYAESGGQVGDTGVFEADGVRFAVADT
ncbi:alanine--tRNA ligase-related protein, partial [Salmonella enterica]|uniref:alanine--tRNA ligase-related protein n=1 Tax=Salmonella enterica TaxID=28901 RepID=UPI0020C3CB15